MPVELTISRVADGTRKPGEWGEILMRGPTVTCGYFDRPRESERVLRDGWLHTGDIGYLDQEGYLYVVDRKDDLIVTGGENVHPDAVESALRSHDEIREVRVWGEPDPEWGQVVVAAVETSVDVDRLAALVAGLPPHMRPRR